MSDLIITNGDEKLYVFDYVEGGSNLPVYELVKNKKLKTKAVYPACLRFMPDSVIKEINL
jgi:hypothetical protein